MAPSVNPENGYEAIDKVSKMPQEEFKRQIQDWMELQQPKLQSQLRKDLIENFTKTGLGRQITSTMQNRQGIVLSPLTLVLNTLVSEFLHSQDYHFTLCVFATEVVFPHTLPDFSKDNFAFCDKELDEIFEAMGLGNMDGIDGQIGTSYYQLSQEKEQRSLLYAVIKGLIDHLRQRKDEKLNKHVQAPGTTTSFSLQQQQPQVHPPGPKKPPRYNQCSSTSDSPNTDAPINVNNLKVLNKTIEKLSKSVKNMARHYMNMETSRMNNKSHHSSKLEMDRDEKHYCNLMRHIENIGQKLDKCVVNFESLEERLSSQRSGIDELFEKMRYRDWFARMTTSKNGQKYIDKFQRTIQRYWEMEREKLKKHYQEKFYMEKRAMKLKYKEELREQIEQKLCAVHEAATDINKDAIQEILESKMQTIETRDNHLGKKLEKLEEIVHEYKGDEIKKKDEIRRMAQKLTETLKTVEKTVQQVPESIECLEKRYSNGQTLENEVDNIIKSAKSRIKKLEQEGESLEKNFLSYLERQNDKKHSIETDRIRIWQDYQLERRALHARPLGMQRTSTPLDVEAVTIAMDKNGLNYDEMAADLNTSGITGDHKPRDLNMANPFKTFDTATYLQKAHERRLLEGPKIERLEAYRRLDREVENIKRKVFMDNGFKPGASNMYLNPRGGSIFGASRYLSETKENVEEKEIQTDGKEVTWHNTVLKSNPIPTISVQNFDAERQKLPLPSSDRSSPLKSDLDLAEVTLDIELSKTTKSSNGNSSNDKPMPDIGLDRKSPQEKGASDSKEREISWRQTDETLYKSMLMPEPAKNDKVIEEKNETIETTVKEMTFKYFDEEISSEQKSSTTFETEVDRMTQKAMELNEQLNKDLTELLKDPNDRQMLDKLMAPSSTTSDFVSTEGHKDELPASSSEEEHFKISTGKPSSSETSEDFWK